MTVSYQSELQDDYFPLTFAGFLALQYCGVIKNTLIIGESGQWGGVFRLSGSMVVTGTSKVGATRDSMKTPLKGFSEGSLSNIDK